MKEEKSGEGKAQEESARAVVEELPLQERVKLAETEDPYKNLEVGNYIDAMDTVNNWCLSRITTRTATDIRVNYDGWSSRYDDSLRIKSGKLCPFRLASKGYTGQVRIPLRTLTFSMAQLEEQKAKLMKVLESNFACLATAFEVTQYLRGELYVYVDFLMAGEYTEAEKEVPAIIEFLKLVARVIAAWIDVLPSRLRSFIEWQSHPKLILVDRNVALAACGYEVLDMLKWLFCHCHRNLIFFEKYDADVEQDGETFTKETDVKFSEKRNQAANVSLLKERMEAEEEVEYGLFHNLFNAFCRAGGFGAVLDIVCRARLQQKSKSALASGYKLPLDVIAMLLSPFKTIKTIANSKVIEDLVTIGMEEFFSRITSLDEKEVKDLNKENIMGAIHMMKGIIRLKHSSETANKIAQTHEMCLALKFLQSASLEKRIAGITEIRKLVDRVDTATVDQHFKAGPEEWLTAEYLSKWIQQNRLLELVFNENAHPELVRRSSSILMFLTKKGMITAEILEQLWKCQVDRHEDIVRVVYDTIKEITEYLTPDHIQYLFSKIREISLENYDEKLVGFMKDFSICAYLAHEWKRKLEMTGEVKEEVDEVKPLKALRNEKGEIVEPLRDDFYCLPIFWKLLMDDSPVSPTLSEQCLGAFKELIGNDYCASYRYQYLCLCMENVRNHVSVHQSLSLAHYLLILIHTKNVIHKTNIVDVLRCLLKEYDLIAVLISSCEWYVKMVNGKIEKMGEYREEIKDQPVCGKYRHALNLESRLKFLELVLSHGPSDMQIGATNLQHLWELYVIQSKSQYDTRYFLQWLSAEREIQGRLAPIAIFQKEENCLLFKTICMARRALADVFDESYFKCFAKNFKLVNIYSSGIALRGSKIFVLSFESLVGLDALWECVSLISRETTQRRFCELLVGIYLNIDESLKEQIKEIFGAFIDRSMKCLMGAGTDEVVIGNLVRAILQFFHTVDGSKYGEEEADPTAHQLSIPVNDPLTDTTHKLSVPIDVKLGEVRKKTASAFNIPFGSFHMVAQKDRVLNPDDDEEKLRNVGWATSVKLVKHSSFVDPKPLLAHNDDYISYLLALLSKETSYVKLVWDLLSVLPPNEKLQSSIKELSVAEGRKEEWNELLDSSSIHKLLYSLQIADKLLEQSSSAEAQGWIGKFCEMGGATHLLEALIDLPDTTMNQPLTRQCFSLLLTVLNSLQKSIPSLIKYLPRIENAQKRIAEKILEVFTAFAHYSIVIGGESRSPKKLRASPSKQQASPQESATLKKKMEEESKTFEKGFQLLKSCLQENFFESIIMFGQLKELLVKGLIKSDNSLIRLAFAGEIEAICRAYNGVEYSPSHPHVVLLPLLLKYMITETIEEKAKCFEFYRMLCSVLKHVPRTHLTTLPVDFLELSKDLSEAIIGREIKESQSNDVDHVLAGMLNTLGVLLAKFPEHKSFVGQKCGVVNEVLHKCLFEFPTKGKLSKAISDLPPKCKSAEARQAAFNLLSTLARDVPENLMQILNCFIPIHANAAWRTKRFADWDIVPDTAEKSVTGYVGMKNLGCICYMNSLLQQFYMIPTFRNDVLAIEDKSKGGSPDDNMMFQLQCMFSALNMSVKQSYNPKIFCHAFKDWDGNPVNVMEQMDADEFFNMFLDKLEFAIKGSPQQSTIKYHFGGQFSNQLLGKDCPHSSSRSEPFLALNLQVKNKKSLEQALESFVEGEMLQGSNAYHCEKCDKKVTALKRVCIKRLPRYLICVLKRFDINYDTMQKFKINDLCEFPVLLNMEPYTEEGLARKDREKEVEKARKEMGEIPAEAPKPKHPNAYYEYKLTGVVIHFGTADAGHYYSLIMDREKTWVPERERWYEFNDTFVDEYNLEDLPSDAFGGEEKFRYGGYAMKTMEKIRNAYLLVYERVVPYDPPVDEDEEETESRAGCIKETTIPEYIQKALVEENVKYWYSKMMFNPDYWDFALKLCLTWNSSLDLMKQYPCKNCDHHLLSIDPETVKRHAYQAEEYDFRLLPEDALTVEGSELPKVELTVFKYASTLLLSTIFRTKKRGITADFVDVVKAFMNKNVEAAQWFLAQFTNSQVIHEFLLESCSIDKRRYAVGLLFCAMLRCYERERHEIVGSISNPGTRGTLVHFANCWMSQLPVCTEWTAHFEHFFQVLANLTLLGPEMREYLLRTGAVRRLLGFMLKQEDGGWKDCKGLEYSPTEKPELGLPSAVDERYQTFIEDYIKQHRDKYMKNVQPMYTFLFEALLNLVRATALSEAQPLSPLSFATGLREAVVCAGVREALMDAKTAMAMMEDCSNQLSISFVTSMFMHLSWESLPMKEVLVKAIVEKVGQAEYQDLKKYFVFLRYLCAVPDSCQEKLVSTAMDELNLTLKNNQNAYFAMHYSVDSLIALLSDVELCRKWHRSNPELVSWIPKWIEENLQPPTSEHSTVKLYKSALDNTKYMRQHIMSFTSEAQTQWKNANTKHLADLKNIAEGGFESKNRLEQGKMLYREKLLGKQIIEHYEKGTSTWTRAVVLRVLDEEVYARPEDLSEKHAEWHEMESEALAPEGANTFSSNLYKELSSSDDDFLKDASDGS